MPFDIVIRKRIRTYTVLSALNSSNCRYYYHGIHFMPITSKLRTRSSSKCGDLAQMNEWTAMHQAGSGIEVQCNPSNPGEAVFASADVPLTGACSPDDLMLALIFSTAAVVLISLGRLLPMTDK